MKILYVAPLSPGDSAQYRFHALERLGHQPIPLNLYDYGYKNSIVQKIAYRLVVGPEVRRFNRDLLRLVEEHKPDVVWGDKLLMVWPKTLDRIRSMGIITVSYMIDNFFGLRNDPGWRLYAKTIRHYDLHVTQRDQNMEDYKKAGAKDVMKVQTAYEPTIHFPPPENWADQNRDRDVSFIGSPYDERAAFLTKLWKQDHLPVTASGGLVWKRVLDEEAFAAIYRGQGELRASDYREGIWRSKINLSFLTHSNQDEFAHKSFEIAACQGFLLVERSEGHLARFREDEEAVFFSTYQECVEKIRRYLPDEEARTRIAAAGRKRAVESGYDNDTQVKKIIQHLELTVPRLAETSTGSQPIHASLPS